VKAINNYSVRIKMGIGKVFLIAETEVSTPVIKSAIVYQLASIFPFKT
jgi:hypothetical protein